MKKYLLLILIPVGYTATAQQTLTGPTVEKIMTVDKDKSHSGEFSDICFL